MLNIQPTDPPAAETPAAETPAAETPAAETETQETPRPTKQEVLDAVVQGQQDLAAQIGTARKDGPRRGRPPGSKNRPKDGTSPAKTGDKKPTLPALTPEKKLDLTRRTIEGGSILLASGLGPHWKLPPDEVKALAEVWQPVLDYYDVSPGVGVLIFNASSVTIGLLAPRVQITIEHKTGIVGRIEGWIKGLKKRRG